MRLALARTESRNLIVSVNDKLIGETGAMPNTSTIHRDAIRGFWLEKDVSVDASLLKQDTNTLKLTVPQGGVMSGIMYNYLRLELDESGK